MSNYICKYVHNFVETSALVTYSSELGGYDIYEKTRRCKTCNLEEILDPIRNEFISKKEFDKKFGTQTILGGK